MPYDERWIHLDALASLQAASRITYRRLRVQLARLESACTAPHRVRPPYVPGEPQSASTYPCPREVSEDITGTKAWIIQTLSQSLVAPVPGRSADVQSLRSSKLRSDAREPRTASDSS